MSLAMVNIGLHAVGLIFAKQGMRPGSPLVPVAERMAYLAGRPAGWVWGWGIWMACSLLLVAYVAALRSRLPGRSFAADLALTLAAAGMGVDLLCDVIQIRGLPLAAASGSEPLFLALEALAFTAGLTVANGLYTAAVLLLTLRLGGVVRPETRIFGFGTVVFGTAMAVAGVIPSPGLVEITTGPTIVLYCIWTYRIARELPSAP
jgi:hypothetical protein